MHDRYGDLIESFDPVASEVFLDTGEIVGADTVTTVMGIDYPGYDSDGTWYPLRRHWYGGFAR